MRIKLRRGPLIPIGEFLSWSKEQQEAWLKRASEENKNTFYLSEHIQDLVTVGMIALILAMLLTGRFPLQP